MRRGLAVPWWLTPLAIFLGARVVSGVLIVLVARGQVSSSQLPPNLPMPTLVDPPTYLHVIANWDGQWYRHIAVHGYPANLPTHGGVVQQNSWAFFPLFPALLRGAMACGLSFGAAASVVSLISGGLGMCVLYRMLLERAGRFTAALTVLALSNTLSSPIFQAAYAESLALLLVVSALYGLERRKYLLFGCSGALLGLTRAITPPLVVVCFLVYLIRARSDEMPADERRRLLIAGCAVTASAVAWPAVVGLATGDMAAYFKTQEAWSTVAGNTSEPWLLSMWHVPAQATVIVIALAALAVICIRAQLWPTSLRLWPVPYMLFVLAVTPATASVLRFSLLTAAPWWPVPELSARASSRSARASLVLLVAVLGLALQWWWLRTYFVIDQYSHGHP